MAPHRVPERDQPHDGEAGDEIVHARHCHYPAKQLGGESPEHPVRPGGLALELAFGDHQIGTALDPAHQVRDHLRVVGEIGVHQDGLVHLSQITNRFIKDPNEVLKVHQKVEVTVTEVDVNRKRISLSMKENEPRPKPTERKPDGRKPAQQNKPHFNSGTRQQLCTAALDQPSTVNPPWTSA